MFVFRTVLVALMALVTSIATAAELPGRLTDRNSGQPIEDATVTAAADGLEVAATTGPDGEFVLVIPEPLPPSLLVRVVASGYTPLSQTLTAVPSTERLDLQADPVVFRGAVEVTGLRATVGETPVTVSTIDRQEIDRQYWAQDVPMLLESSPGFYAYNDSGNGIGYSYFFLRSFDMRRTAISLNGVPLNDAHSHSVFFIDLADFLSTTEEIQVQRGVGTTLYGGSAIGGSVDIRSRQPLNERRLRLAMLGGSYGTSRLTVEFDSGLIDDRWATTARYSRVQSDGYRDQSWVEMWNYDLSIVRYGETTTLRLNFFGGPEETHLAYEGIPKAYLDGDVTGDRRRDRRFNPFTYANEIDSFFQPHYQLIHSWQIDPDLVWQNTFYAFQGDGFFQQFREDEWMPEYRLEPFELPDGTVVDTTDLVRRREVDEWDAGWIPNVEWRHGSGRGSLQAGAAVRIHTGRHWGFVQFAQHYPPDLPPDHRYYDYRLDKQTVQPFVQERWRFDDRWTVMAGLTWTRHRYDMHDDRLDGVELEETYSYLLPRFGITFKPGGRLSLFANVSRGGREPAFRDIYDPQSYWTPPPLDLDPEEVTDYELGGTYRWPTGRASLNLYYLDFNNAIVWAGGLDNNGDPVTANGAVTEHRGAELDLEWQPTEAIGGRLNLAWADNRIVDFTEYDFTGGILDHSGNALPVSPEWLGSLAIHGRLGPATATLVFRYVDDFFLDNTEDMRKHPDVRNQPDYIHRVNDAYVTADLAVDLDLGSRIAELIAARRASVNLRVNNLTDELYTTFGYFDGAQPVWIPAATRNAYAGLVIDW